MDDFSKKIIFTNLQLRNGNQQSRLKKELFNNLRVFRNKLNDSDFNNTFDCLIKNKLIKKRISGNLFPNNINEMGWQREIEFSNQVKYELRWNLKIFSNYTDIINEFCAKKIIIDELILCNEYEKALNYIDILEGEYGTSYWLLENKIFLWNQLKKDIRANILEKAEDDVARIILQFYNRRSAPCVSSREYSYFVKKALLKLKSANPDMEKTVTFIHYMIAPFFFNMNDKNMLYMLDEIKELPLIDRYLCFIDICQYILIKSKNTEYQEILKGYIFYAEEIKDSCVTVIRFMLDTNLNRKNKYHIEEPLMEIKNKYFSGKIEESYQDIIPYIKENISDVSAYNLYIEICQLLDKKPQNIEVSDNVKIILKSLNSIYSVDENYEESINVIYKLCFSCIHSIWANDIYNYINKLNLSSASNLQNIFGLPINLNKLSIETICGVLSKEEVIQYFDDIENDYNVYVEVWKTFIVGDYKKAVSFCGLKAFIILLTLIESHEFLDFKSILIDDKTVTSIYKNRYANILWNNMDNEINIEAGIDYFLHLFIQREEFASIAPMKKFMEFIGDESVEKDDLRIPILQYIYTTYFDSNKRDDLSIACENFFYFNKIEKPSQMCNFKKNDSEEKLIFFLRYICIPQIMGPVLLSIRNSKDLDQERINTCQCLRSIDSKNEERYEQEIRDITHKLFINEGLSSIENSKIHVNTEGIKSVISKNLKTSFNNYIFYRNNELDPILKTIKNIEGGEIFEIISLEPSQIFNEIVTTIRNEFVSGGEYGLDGYLSLNIRHGTLSAQLRAPLGKNDLLTTYMVDTDTFDVNERWLYKVPSSNDRAKIKSAIIKFNQETNDIIEYLRKTLIQISTEEKPSNGVFDYSLNENNIKSLQVLLTENCEFEEFIDKVFDYLWAITEHNLNRMKDIIRDEIKQKYSKSFAKLVEVIKGMNEKYSLPESLRCLNEAQNDIDAELEKICNWFKRSAESQHADFDLDLAFQIGFKMIENIHPEKKFKVRSLNKDLAFKIPGKFLKNYWDIFYTLFDNVSEYALEENGVKFISCDMKVNSDGTFIKMTNQYDCSNGIDCEEVKVKKALDLISGAAYLARAKQEGGSGIPKICKILSIDLDKKANIKCYFSPEMNQFTIEIKGVNK